MLNSELERLVVELAQMMRSRFYGKYKGTVREVGDGDKLGYIKVEIPEVYGENVTSPWVQPHVPFAGPNYGLLMLPEAGDGVWVEFETGDVSRPIWTGFWWSTTKEIPGPSEKENRLIVTPNGHKIVLDDENDGIGLIHASGAEIKLTSEKILLKIGSAQIVLSAGDVNINNGALVVR